MTNDIRVWPRGNNTRLTRRQIREIWRRRHAGDGCTEISDDYGIHRSQVTKIYNGLLHFADTLDLRRERWRRK